MVKFMVSSLLCVILARAEQSEAHSCGHVAPRPDEVIYGVPLDVHVPHHVIRKRSLNQHLRIHLDYDSSVAVLPDDKQNLVKTDLILDAVAYWETTLQVRNTTGPIKLLRQCSTDRVRYQDGDPYPYCVDGCKIETKCGESVVPENHLEACRIAPVRDTFQVQGYGGAGVRDSDFILYISAHQTDRCSIGTTVAYAAYCQLERTLDRPVAGYVNLCPNSISTKGHDLHQMHSTIKHEILHALGFSAGLYAFYRDQHGEPLTPRLSSTGKPVFNQTAQLYQWSDHVIRTITRENWGTRNGPITKTISMLVTPKVVEHVREHFACPALEGAELEDQGVIGTAITHWEKRVFENEVMTGTYTQNPLISDITLALMEDTGKQHIHPYCDRPKTGMLITECTESREAVALCNLVKHNTALPPQFQYFSELPGVPEEELSRYGGTVILADFCPYIQVMILITCWSHLVQILSALTMPHLGCYDAVMRIKISITGAVAVIRQVNILLLYVLKYIWHKYKCSADTGLIIIADGKEYRCYHEGQELQISALSDMWLHLGKILCPPCIKICQTLSLVTLLHGFHGSITFL
ncbi:hypothetical protein LSH36_45g05007 [Paralvinella palmiformis]|uniref:Leishmanolysin-like peptidase n=1 Tax=Paralvinella palmiformis TaxID=53620 RepID=A0AAD9K6B6_9ANNE|nr:hypothetical protein LSH36_45g05007 [Paralvinella palmiformis]